MATAVQYYRENTVSIEHRVTIEGTVSGASSRDLGRRVLSALEAGERHVVVDCANWKYVDFIVLSTLLKCTHVFKTHGATLELANLSAEVEASIRDLRLHHRLRLAD